MRWFFLLNLSYLCYFLKVTVNEIRQINYRKISLISKYLVFIVGTRRINSIFISKKFSVPLTSESVTPGQAGWSFPSTFFTV